MTIINKEFISCVRTNDIDAVATLLKAGANIQYNNNYALRISVKTGTLDMVATLLECGASPDAGNGAALRRSVERGRLDIVSKLLEFGASTNVYGDNQNYSPLENAVYNNDLCIVIKLLEYGANIHFCDDFALRLSIIRGYYEIMTVLLERGANVHRNDKRILKDLQISFDEKIADIVLPYCSESDYEYFPVDYIRSKLNPTKSASATT